MSTRDGLQHLQCGLGYFGHVSVVAEAQPHGDEKADGLLTKHRAPRALGYVYKISEMALPDKGPHMRVYFAPSSLSEGRIAKGHYACDWVQKTVTCNSLPYAY